MTMRVAIRAAAKGLAGMVLALLLSPATSHAHLYDYEYVGLPFDRIEGATYTPANHVTISLLTDHPLSYGDWHEAVNQSSEMISFIMSDGYQTLSSADGYLAELEIYDGLNPDGTPIGWWIWLADNQSDTRCTVYSENSPDGSYDIGISGSDSGGNFVEGTWTVTKCSSPVPEPSTALLLATGMAGMAGATWWRRKSPRR